MSQGVSVQGVSVPEGICPGDKCPGGICQGGLCPRTMVHSRLSYRGFLYSEINSESHLQI